QRVDLFAQRRRVLPGLTGWAQVNGFRGETRTTDDIRTRLQYDLYYVRNWSLWFDIEILCRTVVTLLRGAH
ncbi:MAG: sugar transferase, partial [Pseudomonadota bacterium]